MRAISNALTQNRLHHAYLLTGTRGVGKTTLARIIAKALNCETGVTATPCGKCGACTQVDAGRFVDLIELDAASNTQVDSMRELLENVDDEDELNQQVEAAVTEAVKDSLVARLTDLL